MKLIKMTINGDYRLKAETIEDSKALQELVNEQSPLSITAIVMGMESAISFLEITTLGWKKMPNLMTNENNPEDVWCATCRKWITRTAISTHICKFI